MPGAGGGAGKSGHPPMMEQHYSMPVQHPRKAAACRRPMPALAKRAAGNPQGRGGGGRHEQNRQLIHRHEISRTPSSPSLTLGRDLQDGCRPPRPRKPCHSSKPRSNLGWAARCPSPACAGRRTADQMAEVRAHPFSVLGTVAPRLWRLACTPFITAQPGAAQSTSSCLIASCPWLFFLCTRLTSTTPLYPSSGGDADVDAA